MSAYQRGAFGVLPIDGLALSIALAASGLAVAIVFVPSWRGQAEQRSLSERRAGAERRVRSSSEELHKAQTALLEATTLVDSNGVRTLPVSAMNTRLAELVSLAGRSGLKLDALSPGEKIPTTRTISVLIRMNGSGSVGECQLFLQQLRLECPDVAVTSILLNRPRADDAQMVERGGERVNFAMDLVWHAVPEVPIAKNRRDGA